MFICVNLCSTCVHLCSFVFHLCSFVFICVPLVFICVHLCSFVFHLCSFVFTCVPLVWCFRLDRLKERVKYSFAKRVKFITRDFASIMVPFRGGSKWGGGINYKQSKFLSVHQTNGLLLQFAVFFKKKIFYIVFETIQIC